MSPKRTRIALCLAAFAVLVASTANAGSYDVSLPPGANYDKAEFRLWLPDGLDSVRAVLVLVPGSNGDGRAEVDTKLWQELAAEQGLALLALYMTDKPHDDMFIEHYVDVGQGSGDALLAALTRFAELSGRAEIGTAPLLLWGMSAGGEFNYEFSAWRPERVAAFVVNKGGIYYSALVSAEARRVPGLFFVGSEDLAFRNDIVRGIFSINRRAHALWALIEQHGIAHEVAGSDEIAAAFYRQVLDERLGSNDTMRALDPAGGYYCDPVTRGCAPAATAEAPKTPVSWLANEALAELWLAAAGRR